MNETKRAADIHHGIRELKGAMRTVEIAAVVATTDSDKLQELSYQLSVLIHEVSRFQQSLLKTADEVEKPSIPLIASLTTHTFLKEFLKEAPELLKEFVFILQFDTARNKVLLNYGKTLTGLPRSGKITKYQFVHQFREKLDTLLKFSSRPILQEAFDVDVFQSASNLTAPLFTIRQFLDWVKEEEEYYNARHFKCVDRQSGE